jgi:NhaC family Na+:H+ antiporter
MSGGNAGISGIYMEIVRVAASGFKIDSGHEIMDGLFNRGGMSSMLQTIWLIMMAMIFGGALEATGMLAVLASSMLRLVSGTASLLSTVVASCLLLNITVSDQYLAIVVPGRMFRDSFDKFGLHAKNLSRALEDSGTVTSVLVPWNSCGAYNAGVLGVSTLTYLPFCFFNLASPLMSILLAVTGFTIEKKSVE